MPAPQKDDPDIQINQQFNTGLTEMEAARRVAFMLARATYDDPTVSTIEHEPQGAYRITPQAAVSEWTPPTDAPDMLEPEDPDRKKWIEEIHLSEDERRDRRLVDQTKAPVYFGSAAEQGHAATPRPTATKRKTSAELCRSLSRSSRRDELL